MRYYIAIGSFFIRLLDKMKTSLKGADILMSYIYYIKNRKQTIQILKEFPYNDIIIDSGVFTFLNNKSLKLDLDEYSTQYMRFLKEFQIQKYVEIDLYDRYSIERIEAIRKKIEDYTGIPSIPVVHKYINPDYFQKLIEEYDYIAISMSSTRRTKNTLKLINPLTMKAHSKNCKVHLLGIFDKDKNFVADSCDFANITISTVNGLQYEIIEGKLKTKRLPKDNKLDRDKLYFHNLETVKKYIKYLTYGTMDN